MPVLRYGTDSSVNLEFAEGAEPMCCGTPRGEPLADLPVAVAAALRQPLDYPPLIQTATPGDRVVVALGQGLPQVAQVTDAVVRALVAAGVAPDGISVLRTESDVEAGMENPCRLVEGIFGDRVRLVTHDSAHRQSLAYLAASEGGEPILLNRLLTDADVVLPIGCLQRERTTGYFGIHTAIYPDFSDLQTQARFRRRDKVLPGSHRHRDLKHEANHVAWLLGVNFTVQLVPGGGDDVLHVVAGQSDAVRHRSRELYREAWTFSVADRAELVVAAIEGGRQQQTWDSIGHALESAAPLVEPGGAIALCCDLATTPGPALQRLVGEPSRETALRHIRRESPRDALPALQLARTLEDCRVYFLSKLEPGLVEELELIPISGPEELARLAHRSRSCLLLSNAARAMVKLKE